MAQIIDHPVLTDFQLDQMIQSASNLLSSGTFPYIGSGVQVGDIVQGYSTTWPVAQTIYNPAPQYDAAERLNAIEASIDGLSKTSRG